MIYFRKLFEVLRSPEHSQYTITRKPEYYHGNRLSPATLQLLRCNANADAAHRSPRGLNTSTIIRLWRMLNCTPRDIMEQDLANDAELRKTIQYIREEEHKQCPSAAKQSHFQKHALPPET